ITNFMRPGASSSTVWMAEASTDAWRVKGLVTAGKSDRRRVWVAAWPRMTNVSREIIWLSRMPAPSKPAASMSWISRISSGMGAVPGTRRWTRAGAVISLVRGPALLAERRHAFLEVGARPYLVAECLLHRLASAGVLRDGGADLPLHRLHGGGAVGRDQAAGEEQVHGMRMADLLSEFEGGAAERIDRPLHLGQPEARVRDGATDVRGEQQLEATADAVAVHCGDHGLGVGVVLEERMAHHARRLRRGAQVAADVGARAEGACARSREDDAAAVARLELVPELREVGEHGPRHGVEPRRVVDGDEDDVRPAAFGANLHQRGPGTTTTLPCALRAVSRVIASTVFSSGSRWLMHGLSLPSRYQARRASTERLSLSGACQQ